MSNTALRVKACALLLVAVACGGCSPEIGSKAWCEKLSEMPKGDWSSNEAADYARHCLFRGKDES